LYVKSFRYCYYFNPKNPIYWRRNAGLFIGEEMQDYFLTSIQPVIGEEINKIDDWKWVGPKFV
jgi:hypothetical protein